MKSNVIIGIVGLLFLFSNAVVAQKAPVKFGKIDIKDLEMTSCEFDPEAPAMVLCSYGSYNSQNNTFTHIYRVKIFKKEGYDLANKKFRVSKKSNVKGKTYNLVDGEVVEEKLGKESVFWEKVTSNYWLLNVAMPNVKEGSVIDLEITYGFPSVWYFQETIPVQWSELRLQNITYLTYNMNFFGYHPLKINENNRWVAENVPAFKSEPFMDSEENYITKFEMDITEISIPGYYYDDLAATWEAVSETLLESEYFGEVMKSCPALSKVAKEIDEKYEAREDKVIAAVDYIKELRYNDKERLLSTESSFTYNLREREGNSADLNLMLVKMLKKMDFEVYPVVLSTKDNGYLSPVHPSIGKLNYVIAYVKIDDDWVLTDATDDLLPYYLLPPRCLNWRGQLVDEDLYQWIDLKAEKKYKETVMYNLNLSDEMKLVGQISYKREDYAAYDFRKEMKEHGDEDDYIRSLEEKHNGLDVLEIDINNLSEIYQPVTDIYEVSISDWAYEMDSTVYLQIALLDHEKENPFKAKERLYPVDFIYPREEFGIIKITVPDGYQITEIPKPAKFVLPENNASFIYMTSQMGNTINIQYRMLIDKSLFVLDEYDQLKALYNEIIKKEAEPIVLIKNGHDL